MMLGCFCSISIKFQKKYHKVFNELFFSQRSLKTNSESNLFELNVQHTHKGTS